MAKRWGVFQMENSTTPSWKVEMEHSHFLITFSSDCHVPTKDFTLNESAFSNREILHRKNSGQLYSKRQARKSSNYLTGIAIKSNHCSVLHQAASSTAAEPGFPSTVCLPLIICHFSALPPTPLLTKKKKAREESQAPNRGSWRGIGREKQLYLQRFNSTEKPSPERDLSCWGAGGPNNWVVKLGGTFHVDHYQKANIKQKQP